MNTFKKHYGQWVIVVRDPGKKPGDDVQVTTRSGKVKTETLGEQVAVTDDGTLFKTKVKERKITSIGDLKGIMALFDKARQHLKFPAIVMSIPAINETVRINVAGDRARIPGSLNIVSYTVFTDDRRRLWYGRVHKDGAFEQAPDTPQAVADRLVALARDPAKIAAEHGKLTGRCCFCNTALSDERSTAVGYGKVCSEHFGLPWGERPKEFAGHPEGLASQHI